MSGTEFAVPREQGDKGTVKIYRDVIDAENGVRSTFRASLSYALYSSIMLHWGVSFLVINSSSIVVRKTSDMNSRTVIHHTRCHTIIHRSRFRLQLRLRFPLEYIPHPTNQVPVCRLVWWMQQPTDSFELQVLQAPNDPALL